MKKFPLTLILAALLLFVPATAAYADNDLTVTVDGQFVQFDQPPIITNGRTMVPFRAISEALGAKVYWDETTRTVDIFQDNKAISLAIGSSDLYIEGGETIVMDSPAVIVNGRTLIPARYVSEALGCKVDWDGPLRNVIVMTEEYAQIQAAIEASELASYEDPASYAAAGEYGTNYGTVANGYYTNKRGYRIEEADYNDMVKKREQIYAQVITSGMSEFDKVKAIHDWICENVEYNYDYYNHKSTWKPTKYASEHQTAWAAMMLGTAVCAGYSDAFQFLLDGLEIENYYVRGNVTKGGGHAWNIVQLGGNYYQVDTTWDRVVYNKTASTRYTYFLISDSAMAKGRTWEKADFPACPQNYPWTPPVSNFITVRTNNNNYGTVTTSKTSAFSGETITISATPKSGYSFDHWEVTGGTASLGSTTSAQTSFTMPDSYVTITAHFSNPNAEYKVTTSVNYGLAARATANPSSAKAGDTVYLSVSDIHENYEFERWDILPGSGTVILSDASSPNATFTMPGANVSVKAILKQKAATAYTIGVNVNEAAFGTVSASHSTSAKNVRITLTAKPNAGYEFDHWEVVSGNISLSNVNSPSATFMMPEGNVSFKAHFKKVSYTIKTSVNSPSYGESSASLAKAEQGASVTLSATPKKGYAFDYWEVTPASVTLSDKNSDSAVLTMPGANVSVKAYFKKAGTDPLQTYAVNVSPNNPAYGDAYASPTQAAQGASVTLSATPKDGYEFDYWEVVSGNVMLNNKDSSTAAFAMPAGSVSVKAHFKKAAEATYSINVSVNNGSYGTARADSTSANENTAVTLSATPNSGYEFDYWEVISGDVRFSGSSTDGTARFTMPAGDVSVRAHFKEQPQTYNIIMVGSGAGSATATPSQAKEGERVSITATPRSGYEFSHWSSATASLSDLDSATTDFVMPGNSVTITANFKQIELGEEGED